MKKNLYDNDLLQMSNIENNLNKLVEFIIKNRQEIYIDTQKTSSITSFPMLSKNSINLIYHKYKFLSNLDLHSLIYIFDKETIPDILFWKHLNVDFSIVNDIYPKISNTISVFPEYNKKIIYNLTDILNKERTKILNVTQFQKDIVRDLCSRSYNAFENMWLTGKLLIDLANFYSMTISFNISRVYNFSYQEQTLLATIFSYYFLTKCISNKKEKISFMNNLDFLGNRSTIVSIVNSILDIIDENKYEDLDDQNKLIKIIYEISPHRIKSLTIKTFNSMCRTFNLNQIVSLLSIDNPGYWLYNILSSMSGDKTNLFFIFKKINYTKKAIVFCDDIYNSSEFFKSLEKT